MSITVSNHASVVDAARQYAHEGIRVIPLKPDSKVPLAAYKDESRITENSVEEAFAHDDCGVAAALGSESQGLCDVDSDWPEAAAVANELLGAPTFVRSGASGSHHLLVCEDAAKNAEACRLVKFELPNIFGNTETRLPNEHSLCILELRGNGHLTTLPPTQGRVWRQQPGCRVPGITHRSWQDLRAVLGHIAFLALCVRFYPRKGARGQFCMHVAGAMLRSLVQCEAYKDEGQLVREVERCVRLVAALARDEEAHDRSKGVAAIWRRIKEHKPVSGFPKLVEAMGSPKGLAHTLRGWLNPDGDPLPTITYCSADIPELLDRTEQLLLDTEIPIYQRGEHVVQAVILDQDGTVEGVARQRGAQVILPLKPLRLRDHVISLAHWKAVSSKGKSYRCAPPVEFASHYLARVGEWRLPVLNSICTHPTLRADDSLIVNDGYDATSRILVDMQGVDFGIIKEHPTEDEAREALSTLKGVLAEFPFVPDDPATPVGTLDARSASRSVALSSILTAVSRRTMRNAPLHAYDAPEASSGKTLLANIAANIATGLDAPPVTYTGDSDEEKKTLLSLLRTGTAAILYDNVDLPFENASLCSAVTEPTWGCRILGVNELPTVQTNSLFSLTGNNVRLRGDMVSRSIKARINSGLENPQERKFTRILDTYVREHRPELVRAALAVLRWNVSAGYPGLQNLSGTRFADWNRRVRCALVALGEPDALETQKNIRVVDPTKTTLGALLATIVTHMGVGKEFSPSEVLAQMNSNLDLREAVIAALPKSVSPQALGYYLDKHADQVVCGLMLSQSYSKKAKANRYRIDNAVGLAQESGPQDLFA
jgi:hypothetical protein